jgi:hypothetical protein
MARRRHREGHGSPDCVDWTSKSCVNWASFCNVIGGTLTTLNFFISSVFLILSIVYAGGAFNCFGPGLEADMEFLRQAVTRLEAQLHGCALANASVA